MIKLGRLSLVLAGSILASTFAGSVSAQPWDGRDRDRYYRDWQDRDRDWDRDRGWHYGWRNRDRDCYYVRRQVRDRWGDVVVRRYRVCED